METGDTPENWDESTLGAGSPELALAKESERFYLLVFEGESAAMFQLPAAGEVVVGRAENADLRLRDTSVSRRHVQLTTGAGEARLTDLGSQNGTRVNGERVAGSRALASGDVITICSITLVFHGSGRVPSARPVFDVGHLRQRAEEEVDRALRFRRPLTVVAVALGLGVADRPRVSRAIAGHIRLIDVVAWDGADQVLLLMPEADADFAHKAAARLLAALSAIAPKAKLGFATCPADGCDVDTLLASARAAAGAAEPGRVAAVADTSKTLAIGDRQVVVADAAMSRLYALIERLAGSDLPVLVCGETGSGKELAASALHVWSARAGKGKLVALNCAAIAENLVESELFGHEKGAFSGAVATKPGLLEAASGGTVFLDEIGELSGAAQAKLLRVLEAKKVTRVGDLRERDVDIRIVAATNRKLEEDVQAGRFRQDLFFRLSGAMIWLPPLRDRQRDLPLLAHAFLAEACARGSREPMHLSDGALRALAAYRWPGNVRELKNVIDFVAAAVPEQVVEAWHVTERIGGAVAAPQPATPAGDDPTGDFPPPDEARLTAFRPIDDEIRDLEKSRMAAALAATGGNQTRAARLISMPLRTFVAKLKQYDLAARPEPRRK